VELEATRSSRLYDPIKISSASNLIAIADRGDYAIKVFDAEGGLAGQLGRRGRDPGEFLLMADAQFVNDTTIIAVDVNRQTLTVYDVSADVQRWAVRSEAIIPLRPIGTFSEFDGLLYVGGIGPWRASEATDADREFQAVHVFEFDGSSLGSFLDRTDVVKTTPRWASHSAPHVITTQRGRETALTVVHLFGDSLYNLDRSGQRLAVQSIPAVAGFSARQFSGFEETEDVEGSAVASLAGGSLIVLGYVSVGSDKGRLRYHLFDEQLRVLATGLSGPRVLGSRGDTLLALETNGGVSVVEYLVSCLDEHER
jgi:hypothetical protein